MTALKRVVIAGLLAGLALSPKLWLSARLYPQTPVWSGLPAIPPPFDAAVYAALLLSLLAAAVWPRAVAAFFALAVALAALDQSRLQPWFYQYCFMLAALSLPAGRANLCRLIVFSVYFWSGMQKWTAGFTGEEFRWLVEPFQIVPLWLGYAAPAIESGLAIGLLFRRTRRAAAVTAVAMHLAILASIGPLGHNHNTVVWPWNVVMATSVVLLFWHAEFSLRDIFFPARGALARAVLVLFTIAPAFSFLGAWDSYLSWALYAGNKDEGDLYFSDAVYTKLPERLQEQVTDEGPNRNGLNIGTWSFAELNVPAYPEARVYRRVARSLCGYGEVTLVIQGKATLSGGRRRITVSCGAK